MRRIAAIATTVSLLTAGLVVSTAAPAHAFCLLGGTYIGSWEATHNDTGAVLFGSVEATLYDFVTTQGPELHGVFGSISFVTGTTAVLNNLPIESDLTPSCNTVTGGKVGDPENPTITFSTTVSQTGVEMSGVHDFASTYHGSFRIGRVHTEVTETNTTSIDSNPANTALSTSYPLELTVTSETAGPMSIGAGSVTPERIAGYSTLGWNYAILIAAPPGTVEDPLAIVFHAYIGSTNPNDIVFLRNGAAVPACPGPHPSYPSPQLALPGRPNCMQRPVVPSPPDGTAFFTILTTNASVWQLAKKTVPSAPRSPKAIAGKARATVSWTKPLIIGGPAITGYTVTPYLGTKALTPRKFNTKATKQVITGLTKGKSYKFRIAARNGKGIGPKSVATKAVKPT